MTWEVAPVAMSLKEPVKGSLSHIQMTTKTVHVKLDSPGTDTASISILPPPPRLSPSDQFVFFTL